LYTEQETSLVGQIMGKEKGDAKLSGFELSLAIFF
jgi:hypothetical protein